jgi:hypothetical protein
MGEFGRKLEAAIEQGRQPGQAGQRLTQLKEKFPPRGRGFAWYSIFGNQSSKVYEKKCWPLLSIALTSTWLKQQRDMQVV